MQTQLKRLIQNSLLATSNWLGVMLCLFIVLKIAGTDPSLSQVDRYATPERLQEAKKELGLDRPLPQQFWDYTKRALTLDWGSSWARQVPVQDLLAQTLAPTLLLTLPPYLFVWLLVLLLLSWRLGSPKRLRNNGDLVPAYLLMSISAVVWTLVLQYLVGYRWRLFPIRGWSNQWAEQIDHLAIPWMVFTLSLTPPLYVITRSLVQAQLQDDYVRSAKAKGLSPQSIYWRHILPNTSRPLLSLISLQVPYLLTGSFLLESFFSIPGWGSLIVESLQKADEPLLIGLTGYLSMTFIVLQLIAESLNQRLDPRWAPWDRSSL